MSLVQKPGTNNFLPLKKTVKNSFPYPTQFLEGNTLGSTVRILIRSPDFPKIHFKQILNYILSYLTMATPTHEWPPAGPLTTIFTPSNEYCTTGPYKYLTSICMPTSWELYSSLNRGYYSPGICPSGYTSACPRPGGNPSAIYGPPMIPSETAIICCPRYARC